MSWDKTKGGDFGHSSIELNKIYNEDCLDGMKRIPDKSIDMILCDLPYGTTACKWDTVIPFEPLWAHYRRVIKDNGAIVLTASQPFTTALIASNMVMFKYCWVWEKERGSNPQLAKFQPLKVHEDIVVFNITKYNPQGLTPCHIKHMPEHNSLGHCQRKKYIQRFTNYPKSILRFKQERGLHPTQKPVALFEYLIRTYTNEGETVLDNCIGSGTTAIACINTNRNYIGFELDTGYFNLANERIANHFNPLSLI